MTLGMLAEQQGRDQQAIKHYEDSIKVGPLVTGARTNLAALLERNLQTQMMQGGRPNEKLSDEIDRLRAEELPLLQRDADLLPDNAAIQYRLGLALYIAEQLEESAERLVRAADLEPASAQYAQAAALIFQKVEDWPNALKWAREGVRRSGNNPQYISLFEQIRAQSQQPEAQQ